MLDPVKAEPVSTDVELAVVVAHPVAHLESHSTDPVSTDATMDDGEHAVVVAHPVAHLESHPMEVEATVDGVETMQCVKALWHEVAQRVQQDEQWLPPSDVLEQLLATGVAARVAARVRAVATACESDSPDEAVCLVYRQSLLTSAQSVVAALSKPSPATFTVPAAVWVTVAASALMPQLADLALFSASTELTTVASPLGDGKLESTKRRKKDPNAPKAPLSSYIFFSNAERAAVKAELPGANLGEIGKQLGERWRALAQEDRTPWTALAALDKLRYDDEMAVYRGVGTGARVCTALAVDAATGRVGLVLNVKQPTERSHRLDVDLYRYLSIYKYA